MASSITFTDTKDLENASQQMMVEIDKGILEAAYKIRDKVRDKFVNNSNNYDIRSYAEGILLGVFSNHKVKLHAMGYNDPQKKTYKTRFFEGGTITRETKKGANRGHIKAVNSMENPEQYMGILQDCIKRHMDK